MVRVIALSELGVDLDRSEWADGATWDVERNVVREWLERERRSEEEEGEEDTHFPIPRQVLLGTEL